jgi:uncharacterized protein YjlB
MTEPLAFTFEDDGSIPNSPLPLLVYHNAVPADPAARKWLAAGMAQRRASVSPLS